MNSKLFVLALTMAAGTTMTAQADVVTSQEALDRVVAQMNVHNASSHRAPMQASSFNLAKVGTISQQTAPSYYVFNRTSGGFVVAPADDAQPAVLALIDEGSYDEANLPDGFKAWLSEVTTCGAAGAVLSQVEGASARAAAATVSPLLAKDQIAWNQDTPYNTDCPKFMYQGYSYETLAGCAAIAAGQIMRYHKHPEYGLGSVSYESEVYVQGQQIVTNVDRDFSEHNYDWSLIRGNYSYNGDGTKAERAEVAKLVADVACASYMNFDNQASATYDYRVAQALKRNFGYDPSLQLIDHANYSTTEWADVLRAELEAGRPVYLSGANVTTSSDNKQYTTGHAFVCDGYNADGLFHINWGWGGTSDGYFALTSLNPQKQGAGGSAGGYSFMSNAIIGIQPDEGGEEAKAVISLDNEYWETTYDTENDGYVIRANIANLSASDFEGFVAMRFMEGDNVLLEAKQNAQATKALAGSGGQYSLGLDRASLLSHPTVRMELVYAHVPGVMAASAEVRTAMLESVKPEEWIPIASREGAPKSLQAYKDSKDQFTFGSVPEEVYQLRLAGLQTDVTPKAGTRVKFTATVTNQSDIEYFAPLYLFVYNSVGNLIDYSEYNLHLLPAHSTKNFEFTMTLLAGAARYAVAYEDLGYNYNYVPMRIYESDEVSVASPFAPLLEPDPSEEGPEQPGTDPDEPVYTPADGAKAYYVKNVDSGYYLNVVEDERSCAILSDQKEVLYFEPTAKANEYIIKGHTGLYLGGYEDNVWNMSSSCPETWIVETQADGSVAFRAKSNGSVANGYIGFEITPFDYYALGAKAKRNQRTTAHGLFTLEAVDEELEQPEVPNVDVKQITLAVASTQITVGETLTVTATVSPDDATDKTLAWSTSDASVATVEDGVITAVGAGHVVITAKATDGSNVSATLQLEVKDVVAPGPGVDTTIAAVGDSVVMDGTTFPMTGGVAYYIKNVDSGCYLTVERIDGRSVILRNAPEPLYFTASGRGFIIKDSEGLYVGGHTNGWSMAYNYEQVWTLVEVEDGVYALECDKGYVGFDDKDGTRGNISFTAGADGFAAFRNKDYNANHGKFIIERANIYGDVDENRTVNVADVDALVNILLRKKDVTPEADTDLSRFITIKDVTTLIKYLNMNNKK